MLLNNLLSKMGLFTLHNCGALCSWDYLKPLLKSKSRHPVPVFFGYHCNNNEKINLPFSLGHPDGVVCIVKVSSWTR